jgi:hypothetical protein
MRRVERRFSLSPGEKAGVRGNFGAAALFGSLKSVLRFLAEDIGKCLDDVLDSVQRTLVHREKTIR